ncbi:response regulator transcription factor [Sulfitobacter sp. 1A13353]|uniref:response regulator transcription factor n=1 Tax=Sulfitobacter sp. 1A13353 TaxID=3368568 RepID=UPI003745689B
MNDKKKYRILLADDHQVIRDLVASMLRKESDFHVTEASNFSGVQEVIKDFGPFDIVLLDFAMPGMNGLQGVEKCIELNASKPVVLFSGLDNRSIIHNALSMGAKGLISKNDPADSIPSIIRFILSGQTYMPADLFKQTSNDESEIKLSERETEMLGCLRSGMTNREISEEIGISDGTVKLHIRTLCNKLGAKNRVQAVMIAESMGLD